MAVVDEHVDIEPVLALFHRYTSTKSKENLHLKAKQTSTNFPVDVGEKDSVGTGK